MALGAYFLTEAFSKIINFIVEMKEKRWEFAAYLKMPQSEQSSEVLGYLLRAETLIRSEAKVQLGVLLVRQEHFKFKLRRAVLTIILNGTSVVLRHISFLSKIKQ